MDGISLSDLLTVAGVALVVSIIVQVLKMNVNAVDNAFVPWIALVLGIVLAVLASFALGKSSGQEIGQAALTGLLGGASAVSLYHFQKPLGLLKPKDTSD